MWHFFSLSKTHARVQSTVESRYPHMAFLLCPASLHSLLIRSLVSKLSRSPSLESKLSRSPSLVSKIRHSPSSPRRAVTTRSRRVSDKRPAICCCCFCCLYLWGVIQLLTFPLYRETFKTCSYSPAFLAYPSLRVLVMLPPLSFYSVGHPPPSNLKSPAPIFPIFPLGHRYPWAVDPQLAAHCCLPLIFTVPPPGHTIRA